MGADKYAEVERIANDLIDTIKKNDIPGSYPNLAERIDGLMKQVSSLVPSLGEEAQEVALAARRYYSATLWRQEPGGHIVLYSTMTKNLEAMRRKAEKKAKPV